MNVRGAATALLLALVWSGGYLSAQEEVPLPDLSTDSARDAARQRTLAWLHALLSIDNGPASDRYLLPQDDSPGFAVVEAGGMRLELDQRVFNGSMTAAERARILSDLPTVGAIARARVQEAIDRLAGSIETAVSAGPPATPTDSITSVGPVTLLGVPSSVSSSPPALTDDEIVYVFGAGTQMGAAYAYAYRADRQTATIAVQYAIQNARASRCLNEAPLLELASRIESGAGTDQIATTVNWLLQPEQRELLGLISCGTVAQPAPSNPTPAAGPTTVVRETWSLVSGGAPREASYSFAVNAPFRQVRVRVAGGIDDTGDRRVEVFLQGPGGEWLLAESTGSDDGEFAEWVVPASSYGTYRVVLRDLDSQDGGRYPGNGGELEVVLH